MGEYGCVYVKLGRQAPENAKTQTPTGKRADLWGFCSGHRWVIVGSSFLGLGGASGVAPAGFIVRVIVGPSLGHRWVIVGSSSGHPWVLIGSSLGHRWDGVGSWGTPAGP